MWRRQLFLLQLRTGGPASVDYNNAYVYDFDGNRTSVTRNGVASAYVTDSNDEFLSGDGYSVSGYDGHGNPQVLKLCSATSGYNFQYDLADRPKQMTMPGGFAVTYAIDGDSHRVGKTVSGQATKYIYDGDMVVAEVNQNGSFTYELPGVGYVISNGTTNIQNYYQDNAQGSTLTVQTAASAILSQNEYDAYGVVSLIVLGARSDFGYVGSRGYVTDNESGLLEHGHRYYLPILGRFLTQDPSGQNGGLNLYAYCNDNPITQVDPEGLDNTYTRPSWTPTEKATMFAAAKNEFGLVIDPLDGETVIDEVSNWEVGHMPGYEHYKMGPVAESMGISPAQARSMCKADLSIFRPETRATNRSHALESPASDNKWANLFEKGLKAVEAFLAPPPPIPPEEAKAEGEALAGLDPNASPGIKDGESDELPAAGMPGSTIDGNPVPQTAP